MKAYYRLFFMIFSIKNIKVNHPVYYKIKPSIYNENTIYYRVLSIKYFDIKKYLNLRI